MYNCATNANPIGYMGSSIEQRFAITADGDFLIEKLGNEARRLISGRIYLNGEEVSP